MENAIREIAIIIERDSKDTTYKFALLKGCIEICQEFEQYREETSNNQVTYPMGLLVLKWLEYYYPIFNCETFIPQKNGDNEDRSLAFRKHFKSIIHYYKKEAGYISFKGDLKKGRIPALIAQDVLELIKKVKQTIIKMPMTYIGSAIGRGGALFNMTPENLGRFSVDDLSENIIINKLGRFSYSKDYEKAFIYLGYFLTGTESIMFKWVDFTMKVNQNRNNLTYDDILNVLYPNFDSSREVNDVRSLFKDLQKKRSLECVWSGKIIGQDLNIEHVLPYALWKNNDLWNLLPSKKKTNSSKGIRIPTKELIHKRKDCIINYWKNLHNYNSTRFENEVQIALLGKIPFTKQDWELNCLDSLTMKCDFLINQRGYEPFNI